MKLAYKSSMVERAANNIKRLRESKGLSQEQLGFKTECTAYTIRSIEKLKTKNPGLLTLERIAKALDVTVNDLLK